MTFLFVCHCPTGTPANAGQPGNDKDDQSPIINLTLMSFIHLMLHIIRWFFRARFIHHHLSRFFLTRLHAHLMHFLKLIVG